MKKWCQLLFIIVSVLLVSFPASALSWHGKVIDADTGKPVQGAAVVRSWRGESPSIAGSISWHIGTKGDLTDAKGKFGVSGSGLPFWKSGREERPRVYKPGYYFLKLDSKQRLIRLKRVPTIYHLRQIELRKAVSEAFDKDPIERTLFERERIILEASLHLIDAKDLIEKLNSKHGAEQEIAARKLGESLDPAAQEALVDYLSNGSGWKTDLALQSLVKINPQKSLVFLLPKIETGWNPKTAAIDLVQIGAPAVEPLLRMLTGDSTPRYVIVLALGDLRDPRAVEPLLETLRYKGVPRRTEYLRLGSAVALGKIGDKRASEALIAAALSDPSERVRVKAAEALAKIGYPVQRIPLQGLNAGEIESERLATMEIDKSAALREDKAIAYQIKALPYEELPKISDYPPGTGWDLTTLKRPFHSYPDRAAGYVVGIIEGENDQGSMTVSLTFGRGKRFWFHQKDCLKDNYNFQNHSCLPLFFETLSDSDRRNRINAAAKLGRIKHPAAVSYIAESTRRSDNYRRKAVGTMVDINNYIVLVPLVRSLDQLAVGNEVPAVLVKYKDPWIVDQLIRTLKNKRLGTLKRAIDGLGNSSNPKAAASIIHTVKTTPETWNAARSALVNLGAYAVEPLIEELEDKDSPIRILAFQVLGGIKDGRAVKPLYSIWLNMEEDADSRKLALQSMINIGPPAVDQLSLALKDDNDLLRWEAARALGEIGDPDAVEPLINALDDKVPDVSWTASVALGQIGDRRAIEPLISLLDNRDSGLRSSADFSLKKITGNNFGHNSSLWKKWFRQEQLTAN